MKFGKVLAAVAAVSMAAAPVAASAAPAAAKLSLSKSVRSGAPAAKGEQLMGGGAFVAIIAAIAVILGIIAVSNSNDSPKSP